MILHYFKVDVTSFVIFSNAKGLHLLWDCLLVLKFTYVTGTLFFPFPQAQITPAWLPCCGNWPSITPKTQTISSWSDLLRWVATQKALCPVTSQLRGELLCLREPRLTLLCLRLHRVWLTWAKAHWHSVPTIATGNWWVRSPWLDCSLSSFPSSTLRTVSSFSSCCLCFSSLPPHIKHAPFLYLI